jgi:tRNA threonylcarbamoyladenosine biosynthesis protein TsaB
MNCLAIDTSTATMSLALGDSQTVLGEINIPSQKGHSTLLLPAIDHLLTVTRIRPRDLDGIVVGQGPGSYTGVRIAAAAAKAMAWTLGIPLVGVSSLDGLAGHFRYFRGRVVCLFDARRHRCYTALYEADGMGMVRRVSRDQVCSMEALCRRLNESDQPTLFAGDGALRWRNDIETFYKGKAHFAGSSMEIQVRAVYFLAQGCRRIEAGETEDVHSFQPEYLQRVEAEAKWLAENSNREV